MWLRLQSVIMAALFVSPAMPAAALDDSQTGNYWHRICSTNDDFGRLGCLSFVVGLEGGVTVGTLAARGMEPYCQPPTVNNQQRVDIFKEYLAKHPKDRHQYAPLLYFLAMREAYPCEK